VEQELVSIIICAYNAEDYLDVCVNSVIMQTYKLIEVILINDGSTDRTSEIMKKYEESDSRIRVISQDNKGLGASRNIGINVAGGKAIMFLDADDYYSNELVEKAYLELGNKGTEIAIFNGTAFSDDNLEVIYNNKKYFLLTASDEGIVADGFYFLKKTKGIMQSACLKIYNKEFLDRHDIRFATEGYGEDTLFFYNAFTKATQISYIDYIGYYRRYHKKSIMKSIGTENIKSRLSHFPQLVSVANEISDNENKKLVMKQYSYYAILLWIMIFNRTDKAELRELHDCFNDLDLDKLVKDNRQDLVTFLFSLVILLPQRVKFLKVFIAKLAKRALNNKTRFSI